MSCEKAAIYSEGRVAAEEDDVSVFEPEVGVGSLRREEYAPKAIIGPSPSSLRRMAVRHI